jgi:hypothetical protein
MVRVLNLTWGIAIIAIACPYGVGCKITKKTPNLQTIRSFLPEKYTKKSVQAEDQAQLFQNSSKCQSWAKFAE